MEKIKPLSIRLNPDKELDRKALAAWNSIPEGDRGRIVKQLLVKYVANSMDFGEMSAEGDILYSAEFEERVRDIVSQMIPASMNKLMEVTKLNTATSILDEGKISRKVPEKKSAVPALETDFSESEGTGGNESADADLDLLSFYDM